MMKKLLIISFVIFSSKVMAEENKEYEPSSWPYWLIGGLTAAAVAVDRHNDHGKHDPSYSGYLIAIGGLSAIGVNKYQQNKKKSFAIIPNEKGASLFFCI